MTDVSFGSLAAAAAEIFRVRFTTESRRGARWPPCPLWANNGLMHCSKTATLFDHLVDNH
jgi:hypothetical protein